MKTDEIKPQISAKVNETLQVTLCASFFLKLMPSV